MENVISVVFKVESEGYQALTELKQRPVSDGLTISQAALLKKTDGSVTLLDGFDTGVETSNDTAIGGLVGSFLGILGGPIGVLLSGSMGALIGSAVDSGDAAHNASIIEKVTEQFTTGEVAIVALAQETDAGAFDARVAKFATAGVIREDAAEVAEEVRRAQELQKEMERETRKKLREEKKEERKQSIAEHREKIRSDFENLKNKFSKKD